MNAAIQNTHRKTNSNRPAAALLTLALVVGGWGCTHSVPSASAGVVIFREGQPMAAIAAPDDAHKDLGIAVEQFRAMVLEGYGVRLPETPNANVPYRIELVDERLPMLENDRAVIDFPDDHTLRIRGGRHGLIRALFGLMEEHAGVRYLYQGAFTSGAEQRRRTHYPALETLAIPRVSTERAVAFPLGRSSFITGSYFGSRDSGPEFRRYFWSWEARLGAKPPVSIHHNLGAFATRHREGRHDRGIVFPIDRYVERGEYPPDEVFPILRGERFLPYREPESRIWRAHWQPCFTARETEEEAVRNILAFLDAHPDTESISLSTNDNGGHCECPDCLAMDDYDQANTMGMSDRSTSYYHWVNAVVERIVEIHPHLRFGLIAYRETFDPPDFDLHPSVSVILTLDFQPTLDPSIRRQRQETIRAWSQRASHVGFWAYDVGWFNYSLPRAYYREHQEMIQFFHEHNGTTAFAENAGYFTLPEGPNTYAYFKLLEDPYLDREALLLDWCAAAVGEDGAPHLRDYYRFWEEYWRTRATQVDQFWGRRGAHYLQRGHFATYMYGIEPGDREHLRGRMEAAHHAAMTSGTAGQRERADLLMQLFEWHEAAIVSTSAEWIDPDGVVPDAQAAVALLRRIPAAADAARRWREIPANMPDWIASNMILEGRRDRPGVVGFNMAAVAPYRDDPAVRAELDGIAADNTLPGEVRRLAVVLLDEDTPEATSGLLLRESVAPNATPAWEARAVHGACEIVARDDTDRGGAVAMRIEHGNYAAFRDLPGLTPGTDAFAIVRVYIPEANDGPPGTVEFWGQPSHLGWNVPTHTLEPGKWHELYAYLPRSERLDARALEQMATELGGLAEGDHVEELVRSRLMLRLRGFARGSTVLLDAVRVYALPAVEAPR